MLKPLLGVFEDEKQATTPIWLMRQAGRYLPEYRALRGKFDKFTNFCLHPQAAAEATLHPIKRFALDAAILFSDILVVPMAMGVGVELVENVGPVLTKVDSKEKIEALDLKDELIFEKINYTIKLVKSELKGSYPGVALIGFAGGPFTIAAYMIEGKGSRDFEAVRKFAIENPKAFDMLINKIVDITTEYLKSQILSGVEVIKIFDSWAGAVPHSNFKQYIIDPIMRVVDGVKASFPHIPIIVFARNAGQKLQGFNIKTTIDALAIDQYNSLAWSFKNLKAGRKARVLQGNLDNFLLAHGNKEQIKLQVLDILSCAEGESLIFNLGHGVLPQTPLENVEYLVNLVKGREG